MNNTILCVDDEKDIVQAYVDFLAPAPVTTPKKSSRSGGAPADGPAHPADEYKILRAYSGTEAVNLIRSELAAGRRIAGAFFDVKMEGGIDGIQAIQMAWKLDPGINCTIVTAYQDRSVQDIQQLFGDSFKDQWDYLIKPFTQGEIVQKARQMVAAWNRREDLEGAHRQLVRSERLAAVGQVARGVGHEFGNILQRIVGKADLLLGETDPAKMHAQAGAILEAAERAAVITRNLQSFSKEKSAHGPVDIGKVIGETLTLVNHEFAKSSVKLLDKRQPVAIISGNAGEIRQVIMNLVINAFQAMPQGGTLEIGCSDEPQAALFWVRDTGMGISAEVLPRIFDYAFTTKGDSGSGLGLSISRQLIEAHGGTIAVESAPGKGTAFTVRLPRVS